MTAIFKQKTPANIFILLVFGVLIKLPMFMHPHVPDASPGDGILFTAILDLLQPYGKANPIICPLLAFTLLYLQAILLTGFIN